MSSKTNPIEQKPRILKKLQRLHLALMKVIQNGTTTLKSFLI